MVHRCFGASVHRQGRGCKKRNTQNVKFYIHPTPMPKQVSNEEKIYAQVRKIFFSNVAAARLCRLLL